MRRVYVALPLFAVFAVGVALRLFDVIDAMQDLRVAYMGLLAATVLGMEALASRRGRAVPMWIGWSFAGFSVFILMVPLLGLYRISHVTNRFEHLGGFALLGVAWLAFVGIVRGAPLGDRARGLVLLAAWGVGWVNEVIEYVLGWGGPFFTEDTLLDLLMNTLSLVAVFFVTREADRRRGG